MQKQPVYPIRPRKAALEERKQVEEERIVARRFGDLPLKKRKQYLKQRLRNTTNQAR